jgi:probable rRNA maturation factor
MILNRQGTVRVARPALDSFLRRLRRQLKLGKAEVTVCLVSDAEIARMNEFFRKKKGPTDVLSFPADTRSETGFAARRATRKLTGKLRRSASKEYFLGDIAISPASARRNAKKYGRTLPAELRILMLHGMLHLLGFDHETDSGQMDDVEQRLRRRLGLV